MKQKGIYVAATKQNVGKTTVCLGLYHFLSSKMKVGFIKPVGQEHVPFKGQNVDKDVALFLDYFQLGINPELLSPILFSKGSTKYILDGKIDLIGLEKSMQQAYNAIAGQNDFMLVEGTGHVGVGSIANLSCARVSSLLQLDCIMVVPGGIGLSFDLIMMQKAMLDKYGVKIKGVVINKVLENKREEIEYYLTKALKPQGIEVIGTMPYLPFLSSPTFEDFEIIFKTAMISGMQHRIRHFEDIVLLQQETQLKINQIALVPATREELIKKTIDFRSQQKHLGEIGLILTSKAPPSHTMLEKLKKEEIPAIWVPEPSTIVMKQIMTYVTQFQLEDIEKIEKAIAHSTQFINFEKVIA